MRALQDLQFELDDAALLGVDFVRRDYRSDKLSTSVRLDSILSRALHTSGHSSAMQRLLDSVPRPTGNTGHQYMALTVDTSPTCMAFVNSDG